MFQEARAPTTVELHGVLDKIIPRLMKMLTRQGYLVKEQGMTCLAERAAPNALRPLRAASCTYRIAIGPRAEHKVLSLQTLSPRGQRATPALCANAHGFGLHAGQRCGAHQRKELEREMPLYHPTCHCQRMAQAQSRRAARAATEQCLARRHHPHRDVAAAIHAAPGRAGTAPALAPDRLPSGARSQCQIARRGRFED